jgi:hypothetical protein
MPSVCLSLTCYNIGARIESGLAVVVVVVVVAVAAAAVVAGW